MFFLFSLRNFGFFSKYMVKEEREMRKIYVEPERLESTSNSVLQANDEYISLYQSLYNEIDKVSETWMGKENTQFNNKVKSYQDDLRKISIIMRQYAEYLSKTAKSYRETQDELYNQATRL